MSCRERGAERQVLAVSKLVILVTSRVVSEGCVLVCKAVIVIKIF